MESSISISQQHRPISGKELSGGLCQCVCANGFSFKDVVISDQVPIRLAPDVIKNTNLKIAHRVVAEDDRLALASSMSTNELQANSLVTLKIGEAAIHSIGDGYPLLVKMDLVKDLANTTLPNSLESKRLMSESMVPNKYKEILLLHPALNRIENEALYETMEVVQTILENPEL
jgi:hypothetical protein